MRSIISFSGGMDSTTVLALAISQGREVQCVSFCYGSKHNRWENEAARKIAEHYQVPWKLVDLTLLATSLKSNLMKTGGAIPEGHYQEETMRQTVVPGRNTIFTGVLLGIAQSEGAGEIWLGIHAGDHAIYPDCRPEWLSAIQEVVRVASEGAIIVIAPFLHQTKADILRVGFGLEVPYRLTRTCYQDQETACGRCGACVERRESFTLCGVIDPIAYEYSGPLPEKAKR